MINNTFPVVSVGLPVYNEAKYIEKTLASILDQDCADIEVIISDNNSTDGTREYVEMVCSQDSRVRLIKQEYNIGGQENFLEVLREARGQYFIYAGGHDLWSRDCLRILVDALEQDSNLALAVPVHTDEHFVPVPGIPTIDTRKATSPAKRSLLFWQQIRRCDAYYGLFRTEALRHSLPWPHLINDDFIALMRVASYGDVRTIHGAGWYRCENRRPEPVHSRAQRHARDANARGVGMTLPYWSSRLFSLKESMITPGPLTERLKLIWYTAREMFLSTSQAKLLAEELFVAFHRLIREHRSRP